MQLAQAVVSPVVNVLQLARQVLSEPLSGQKHIMLVQRLAVHSSMTRHSGDFMAVFSCFVLQAAAFSSAVHVCEVITVAEQSGWIDVQTPIGLTETEPSVQDTVPVPFADSGMQR